MGAKDIAQQDADVAGRVSTAPVLVGAVETAIGVMRSSRKYVDSDFLVLGYLFSKLNG